MAGKEIKAGLSYKFGLVLIDTGNRPIGKTGVTWGTVWVLMRTYGANAWNTKTHAASDWVEVGNGVYQIQFNAADMADSGEFDYLITDNPSGNRFDDYRGNIYIPAYHSQDIYDRQTTILANQTTIIANIALGATSTDMGTALDALLGDKIIDKTVGPWKYTWYTRIGAVLQTHNYTRSVTTESNVKV